MFNRKNEQAQSSPSQIIPIGYDFREPTNTEKLAKLGQQYELTLDQTMYIAKHAGYTPNVINAYDSEELLANVEKSILVNYVQAQPRQTTPKRDRTRQDKPGRNRGWFGKRR